MNNERLEQAAGQYVKAKRTDKAWRKGRAHGISIWRMAHLSGRRHEKSVVSRTAQRASDVAWRNRNGSSGEERNGERHRQKHAASAKRRGGESENQHQLMAAGESGWRRMKTKPCGGQKM